LSYSASPLTLGSKLLLFFVFFGVEPNLSPQQQNPTEGVPLNKVAFITFINVRIFFSSTGLRSQS
jgi:hypothetical protein